MIDIFQNDLEELKPDCSLLFCSQGSYLFKGQQIYRGGSIKSPNGRFRTVLEDSSGNLVLYSMTGGGLSSGSFVLWSTNSSAFRLVMQNDGDLVLYDEIETPLWSSKTDYDGDGGEYAICQDDGNFAVYATNDTLLWSTKITLSLKILPNIFSFYKWSNMNHHEKKMVWSKKETC